MKRIQTLILLSLIIVILYALSSAQNKDDDKGRESDTVNPTKIKEVLLIPMTHLDIGFTDALDTVAMQCKDNIDQAIQLCERYQDFYWTIESLWQLEQWLLRSTDGEIEHLKKLIDSQRIEVAGMYCTLRSGLLGLEDANRLMYPMQRMKEQLGISFDTVIQNDVPGYADVYPRVFASAGIKYFLTGINIGHSGGVHIPRNHLPFLWQSKDGQSVLTWIDYDGYTSISFWGIYNVWNPAQGVLPDGGKKFLKAIKELEASGYPYSVFLLNAALGDNRQPFGYIPLIEGVRKWNEAGHQPRIRFATPRQFFKQIEQERGNHKFPVYKGNWHGLWDARLWNPAGNILARLAQQLLPVAESTISFNDIHHIGTYYHYDLAQGFKALYLHCEHTCGGDPGWIGVFIPTIFKKTVLRQNDLTLRFAKDARGTTERTLDVSLSELASHINTKDAGILVFNPLQWRRNVVFSCTIPLSLKNTGFSLRDPVSDEEVPFVLEENGSRLVFLARNLPAFGYKLYTLVRAEASQETKQIKDKNLIKKTWAHTIQNRYYRIECDPELGHITSLVDLTTGRELVNKESPFPMNSLVITKFIDSMTSENGDLFKSTSVVYKEEGEFFQRIVIERKGSLWPKTIITLPLHQKRIDIQHILDRNKFPDVSLEEHSNYYSFVFPFKLNESELQVYIDGPDGFYSYPDEYLPGAVLGAVQSQYGVHLQEGDQFGITIANRQSFNWTIGEINFNRKATHIDDPPLARFRNPYYMKAKSVYPLQPTLYSNVVQFATEGWTADFGRTYIRDSEPGTDDLMVFEYFLTTTTGEFSAAEATRFCRESVISPVGIYSDRKPVIRKPVLPSQSDDFLQIEPDNVIITALKKAEFGSAEDYILRLKEVDGVKSLVRLKFTIPVLGATLCSLNEIPEHSDEVLSLQPVSFWLKPFGVATLRVRFRQ